MRTIHFVALICVFALLVGDAAKPTFGQQAQPQVDVKIVDYKGLSELVSANKGKVILLDFWATTCIPCKQSFFHTVEMYNSFRDKGLVVISVATNQVEKGEEARVMNSVLAFLKSKNATFTNVILDEPAKVMEEKLRLTQIPCLYVFNRDGQWTQFIGDNQLVPDADHRHMNVQRYVEYALAQPTKQ